MFPSVSSHRYVYLEKLTLSLSITLIKAID